MDMILQRSKYEQDGICGLLATRDGARVASTLEHAFEKYPGIFSPKIPAGDYTCRRRLSPHFGYDVFEVLDVPNCTFIEIHIGNYNKDSDGCILLGQSIATTPNGDKMLTMSRVTFHDFMDLQDEVNEFQLTIVDSLQAGIPAKE